MDNDVKIVCQIVCLIGVIVFGDDNNIKGELYEKMVNLLNYKVLEEIDVCLLVDYIVKINNCSEVLDV